MTQTPAATYRRVSRAWRESRGVMSSAYTLGLRRRWLAVTVTAVLAVVTALMVWEHEVHQSGISFGPAAAWLPSAGIGELTLVDGPSATVVTGVKVATPGNPLAAAQYGLTGYVFDPSTSKLTRVDGATWELSPPVRVNVAQPETVALTATASGVFLNRIISGRLDLVEYAHAPLAHGAATTGTATSDRRTASPALPTQVTLDGFGRPWTVNPATTELVRATDGHRLALPSGSHDLPYLLVPTAEVPAIVALSAAHIVWLNDDGTIRHREALPRPLSLSTVATGDPASGTVYLVDPTSGAVIVCKPDAPACQETQTLMEASRHLGPLMVVAGRILIPDLGNGTVWILDSAGRLAAHATLFHRPAVFDLTHVQGVIFFNEASSNQAGIIDLDGHVRPVLKYGVLPPSGAPTTTAPTTPPSSPTEWPLPGPPTTPPSSPTEWPLPGPPATSTPTPTTSTRAHTTASTPATKPSGSTTPARHPPRSSTPSTPRPSPTQTRTRSTGTISGPPGGTAKSCAYFSGTADLAPGKTLILAKKNLDNGDPQEYVEYVFGWEYPQRLSTWRGAQYFKSAEDQHLRVRLIAVDLAAAQAANSNDAAANALASQGQGLASVRVYIEPGVGPGGGVCPP
jgi:hypothetical protein